MKTKTKMIIALSLAGVITLGAVIALVVVIASFNATAGSGLSVSYVAKNVEAEVSMGYVVSETNTYDPKSLTYTTVQAGSNDKLTFSSSDTSETVSKNFDAIDEIELTKNGYVYLKYTFKHTGTTANSQNYLNVTLTNTFSALNNIEFEYLLYDPTMSDTYSQEISVWMAGVNGLTITRDGDNECVLFVRMYVDMKTQNALLHGSFVFNMVTSDTDYYANMRNSNSGILFAGEAGNRVTGSMVFDYLTDENRDSYSDADYIVSASSDGSGPITIYNYYDSGSGYYNQHYVMSESEIYLTSGSYLFVDAYDNMGPTSFEFNNINTKYTKNMRYMFYYCCAETLDLTMFDTSNVTIMHGMFDLCRRLKTLDVSSFDTANVEDFRYMFAEIDTLTTIYASEKFVTTGIKMIQEWASIDPAPGDSGMFYNSPLLVGGNGTVYSASNYDGTYARIDTAETPGYFTLKTA